MTRRLFSPHTDLVPRQILQYRVLLALDLPCDTFDGFSIILAGVCTGQAV